MYELYVDESHENNWVSEEDLLAKGILKKKRSNTFLNTDKNVGVGIQMREVHDAVEDALIKYSTFKKI